MPKALKLYANFLIEILNDRESGQELLARARDNALTKGNMYENKEDDGSGGSMTTDGTPCL